MQTEVSEGKKPQLEMFDRNHLDLIKKKFMLKVEKTETCWIWHGSKDKRKGYGRFIIYDKVDGESHRISYKIFKGEIPKGLQIDHLCRNKLCVNPQHLEAVTQKENLRRSAQNPNRKNPWSYIDPDNNKLDWIKIQKENGWI